MDLFSATPQNRLEQPLAVRMRPRNLEEYSGQQHILGKGKLLRKAIEADQVSSMILYGPPGTGKTTLASVISHKTKAEFVQVSATSTGVAELKRIIEESRERRKFHQKKTILFIDEVQRLNKGQQDVLLPAMESGDVILIAATTENPYFEVNQALLSRAHIFQLKPLHTSDLQKIANLALQAERGLASFHAHLASDALDHLIRTASGDARVLLNALEFAVVTATANSEGIRHVSLQITEDAVQTQRVSYDKSGDFHYDIISAFIKSLRGSDPDAALYWFARMVYANEDPRYIVRRLIVHASEDVGMADPTAMLLAQAAANALEWIGMPEARIPIAQAIIYIATAPKSNSVCQAVDKALALVATHQAEPVPEHLRDTHYKGAADLGNGVGYLYPHDYPYHYVPQQYLPQGLENQKLYTPTEQGREKSIKERLEYFIKQRLKS